MGAYIVNKSSAVLEIPYKGFSILYNRDVGKSVVCLPQDIWAEIQSCDRIDEDTIPGVDEALLGHMARYRLIQEEDAPKGPVIRYIKKLIAWLHVTNACNMACTYCNVAKTKGSMTEDTGENMVRRLVEIGLKHGYEEINISMAGGEPTINIAAIKSVLAEVERNRHKIKINLAMITNALRLKDEMIELILTHKIPVSVSFDGFVSSRHNELANHTIFENMLKLKESGVSIFCLFTMDKVSMKNMKETVELLVKHKIGCRFSIDKYLAISKEGDAYQRDVARLLDEAYSIMEDQIVDLPPMSGFNRFGDTGVSSTITRACAIEKDSLQLGTNGEVHYCHTDINQEKPVCNLFEVDPIEFFQQNTSAYSEVNTVDDIPICSTCDWKYQCGGGCPKLTLKTYGTVKEVSPFCNIIKETLPKIIRLQGVQMIERHLQSQEAHA